MDSIYLALKRLSVVVKQPVGFQFIVVELFALIAFFAAQRNIRVHLRSSVDLINLCVFAVYIYLSVSEFLYLMGEVPVHFLKALENALCSEKPSRKAISLMVFTGFLMY